jgi:hypothetical protein
MLIELVIFDPRSLIEIAASYLGAALNLTITIQQSTTNQQSKIVNHQCMAKDTADHGFAPARSFAAVAHSVITVK